MAAVKYGFFFCLLSKLLSVNSFQNNPTDPIKLNELNNGQANMLGSQQYVAQTMPHDFNLFDRNNHYPTSQSNAMFYNQQPTHYKDHYNMQPTLPQHYVPEQRTFIPILSQPAGISTENQIRQLNTQKQGNMMQTPQITQRNSETLPYQSTNMQYSNFNQNMNNGYNNQPKIQEIQSESLISNSQVPNTHIQQSPQIKSMQSNSPIQDGHQVSESLFISSSSKVPQDQSSTNQHQLMPIKQTYLTDNGNLENNNLVQTPQQYLQSSHVEYPTRTGQLLPQYSPHPSMSTVPQDIPLNNQHQSTPKKQKDLTDNGNLENNNLVQTPQQHLQSSHVESPTRTGQLLPQYRPHSPSTTVPQDIPLINQHQSTPKKQKDLTDNGNLENNNLVQTPQQYLQSSHVEYPTRTGQLLPQYSPHPSMSTVPQDIPLNNQHQSTPKKQKDLTDNGNLENNNLVQTPQQHLQSSHVESPTRTGQLLPQFSPHPSMSTVPQDIPLNNQHQSTPKKQTDLTDNGNLENNNPVQTPQQYLQSSHVESPTRTGQLLPQYSPHSSMSTVPQDIPLNNQHQSTPKKQKDLTDNGNLENNNLVQTPQQHLQSSHVESPTRTGQLLPQYRPHSPSTTVPQDIPLINQHQSTPKKQKDLTDNGNLKNNNLVQTPQQHLQSSHVESPTRTGQLLPQFSPHPSMSTVPQDIPLNNQHQSTPKKQTDLTDNGNLENNNPVQTPQQYLQSSHVESPTRTGQLLPQYRPHSPSTTVPQDIPLINQHQSTPKKQTDLTDNGNLENNNLVQTPQQHLQSSHVESPTRTGQLLPQFSTHPSMSTVPQDIPLNNQHQSTPKKQTDLTDNGNLENNNPVQTPQQYLQSSHVESPTRTGQLLPQYRPHSPSTTVPQDIPLINQHQSTPKKQTDLTDNGNLENNNLVQTPQQHLQSSHVESPTRTGQLLPQFSTHPSMSTVPQDIPLNNQHQSTPKKQTDLTDNGNLENNNPVQTPQQYLQSSHVESPTRTGQLLPQFSPHPSMSTVPQDIPLNNQHQSTPKKQTDLTDNGNLENNNPVQTPQQHLQSSHVESPTRTGQLLPQFSTHPSMSTVPQDIPLNNQHQSTPKKQTDLTDNGNLENNNPVQTPQQYLQSSHVESPTRTGQLLPQYRPHSPSTTVPQDIPLINQHQSTPKKQTDLTDNGNLENNNLVHTPQQHLQSSHVESPTRTGQLLPQYSPHPSMSTVPQDIPLNNQHQSTPKKQTDLTDNGNLENNNLVQTPQQHLQSSHVESPTRTGQLLPQFSTHPSMSTVPQDIPLNNQHQSTPKKQTDLTDNGNLENNNPVQTPQQYLQSSHVESPTRTGQLLPQYRPHSPSTTVPQDIPLINQHQSTPKKQTDLTDNGNLENNNLVHTPQQHLQSSHVESPTRTGQLLPQYRPHSPSSTVPQDISPNNQHQSTPKKQTDLSDNGNLENNNLVQTPQHYLQSSHVESPTRTGQLLPQYRPHSFSSTLPQDISPNNQHQATPKKQTDLTDNGNHDKNNLVQTPQQYLPFSHVESPTRTGQLLPQYRPHSPSSTVLQDIPLNNQHQLIPMGQIDLTDNVNLDKNDIYDPSEMTQQQLTPLENKDLYDSNILNGLARNDKSFNIDTEDSRNSVEGNSILRIFANPKDFNLLNLPSIQPSTKIIDDNSNLNNIDLINSIFTPTPWSYNSRPNHFGFQKLNPNTYRSPQTDIFNAYQNQMTYNKIPTSNNNHNQMFSNIYSNINDQSSSKNNRNIGNMYKKIDKTEPLTYPTSSCSLQKHDYSKKQQPNQNDNNSSNDNSYLSSGILEPPLTFNQNNNNMQRFFNQPSSNDMFIQNTITAISNEAQIPSYGTNAIFEVTKTYFPNASVGQQIRLTYAVIQSTLTALRKMLGTVVNSLIGQRVKRDFNVFSQFSGMNPKTTEDSFSLSPSNTLINKNYRQSALTIMAPSMDNLYQPTTVFSQSQPNTVNAMQQQMYDSSGTSTINYGLPNNVGVVHKIPNLYVLNVLNDEIMKAINLNLPDFYTSDSPEVIEYTRQVTLIDKTVFQDQINKILQGNLPSMNMNLIPFQT